MSPRRVLVLHGPNLNLLGTREPEVYGSLTLEQIDVFIINRGKELDIGVVTAQSNIEGELVSLIQDAAGWADAILINPGGYSHTSVAIRDAIAAVDVPTVEVHLSNPAAREEFRHTDVVSGACIGVIAGFGWRSYLIALEAAAAMEIGEGS
jgi:3-dehydroquinate dehydratase-2